MIIFKIYYFNSSNKVYNQDITIYLYKSLSFFKRKNKIFYNYFQFLILQLSLLYNLKKSGKFKITQGSFWPIMEDFLIQRLTVLY